MELSEKRAFSMSEFCQVYGVGMTFAYEALADGSLLARKAGRKNIILKSDADAWLESLPAARPAR